MVFGKQFRPALGGVSGSGGGISDRIAAFGMSLFLGLMLMLTLGGCGSGSDNGGNNNNGNNGNNRPPQTTRLIGHVIDQNNNNGIVAGAAVSFAGVTGSTDNSGNFSLSVPANTAGNLTVIGPANANGSAGFYNTGFVASGQYSLANVGFPVTAITSGQTRDVGTIIIFSQTGPPPPPIFP